MPRAPPRPSPVGLFLVSLVAAPLPVPPEPRVQCPLRSLAMPAPAAASALPAAVPTVPVPSRGLRGVPSACRFEA
ncbi:hypothetical protein [Streptomyces zagrosensis]|uniref:Uncharacterized protein n=1 Tax=Streptomyces zagrosensis TaxID=1042984 RepID=A0A7W9Q6Y9_9ACTN|nr:hypothetical protein [Streptomyces zagrosensis]MBB5933682.1 hypothetical protein [Streptomyces zagrosensis]